jgi:hypothetical protein
MVSLALKNDQIIGCFHLLPQKLKLGNDISLIVNEMDVGVHPDFRGQGIYNQFLPIREKLIKDNEIKLSYGLGGNPILIKHVQRAGERMSFPFIISKMVKIRDINLHQKYFPGSGEKQRLGYHILKTLNYFRSARDVSDSQECTIREIKVFKDDIDTFWNKLNDRYGFIMIRNKEYLNWRYCDIRAGEYIVKVAKSGKEIIGYSVFKISKVNPDYPIGYIVDLLTLPGRIDVVSSLISDGVDYFIHNDVNCIMTNVVKNSMIESILYNEGFITNLSNPLFITYRSYYRNNETNILSKYKSNEIHYSYGDYDGI